MMSIFNLSLIFFITIISFVILIRKRSYVLVGKYISYIELLFIVILCVSFATAFFLGEGLYLFVLFGPLMIFLIYFLFPVSLIGIIISIKLIKNNLFKKQGIILLILSLISGSICANQYYSDIKFLINDIRISNVAKNKFDEISEKINEPQKVIAMDSSTFILEGGLRVNLVGLFPIVFQMNPNVSNDINKFANENIVGNYVKIIIPAYTVCGGPTERTYRDCFGEHGNLDSPEIYGKIYFNNESLNEKFNLVPVF